MYAAIVTRPPVRELIDNITHLFIISAERLVSVLVKTLPFCVAPFLSMNLLYNTAANNPKL